MKFNTSPFDWIINAQIEQFHTKCFVCLKVRRYSDFPPSYETLSSDQPPPSYNSVVIIEEEAPPGDRSSRCSGIRTYVYDPARRISIEVSRRISIMF